MSRHGNISIFVPHIGCPHRCSFCDQNAITGSCSLPTEEEIEVAVNAATKGKKYSPNHTELAFFGGSFTAIDRSEMLRLLQIGYRFVKNNTVCGIRISTRPDAITEEILNILKSFGVTSIELGCQSLSDEVLKKNLRGHTVKDVYDAAKMIKGAGFSLGLQMMTGLPFDTDELAVLTAKKIIEMKPDTVRIYPTIVLKDTVLYRYYTAGTYHPQTVEQAVELTAQLMDMFENEGIIVIRVGLHTVDQERAVAGPWHPAFGELCKSRQLLNRVRYMLKEQNIPNGAVEIIVPKEIVSAMIGQKKANIEILKEMGYNCKVIQSHNKDIVLRSKNSAN